MYRNSSRPMRTHQLFTVAVLAGVLCAALTAHAAQPADFSTAQLREIWKGCWESGDPKIQEPKLEKLSEREVIDHMTGKWTVMFGVIPDGITILLRTNRLVEVSGRKDGKDWNKTGEWRVTSDKLVLFLKQDDLPSFIFKT